jgi:hypothetical protein
MWTLAIVIGLLGIGVLLSFLAKSFAEDSVGIKVLLLMLGLMITIIISRVVGIIIETNATGTMLTNLNLLSTTVFIILISLFTFFIAYFMISYTVSVIKATKDAKERRWRI